MKKLYLLAAIIFTISSSLAQIIYVPTDQPTIQEGIDAATNGDMVIVEGGIYYENINFMGKAITVASEFILDADTNHIANTVIDGSQPDDPSIGAVVIFDSEEDTTSVLCGFTITGGTGVELPLYNYTAGGGIYMYPAGGTIINNIIEYNSVTTNGNASGGGILADHVDEGKVIILNNKIRYNQVNGNSRASGAGIELWGSATVIGNEIIGNAAVSTNGQASGGLTCLGGYYTPDLKEIIIAENRIAANSAHSYLENDKGAYGGGMIVKGYKGLIKNNIVLNNEIGAAYHCYGAGIFLESNSDELIVENNNVMDNYFTEGICFGGGIGAVGGSTLLVNNIISNNKATYGGGIDAVGGKASLINNFISNNEATYGGGTSILLNSSDSLAILMHNTITGNDGTNGGGLYLEQGNAVVINSILWNNTAETGSQIYEEESNLEVKYSDVEGGWTGAGNMNVDPLLKNDGHHLKWESPVANQGKSTVTIDGEYYYSPDYDIDNDDRPYADTKPDIGADEAPILNVSVFELNSAEELSINIFPNPVAQSLNIEYDLGSASFVQIKVINQSGKQMKILVDEFKSAGKHHLSWNPVNLPAGIYFCLLETNNGIEIHKLIKLH